MFPIPGTFILRYTELTREEDFHLQSRLGLIGQYGHTVYNGDPRGFYQMIVEDFELLGIPIPSYIECGHQLRLLYLLDDPINMSMSYAKKALRAISRLQTYICSKLNEAFACGAEPQLISGYYRLPGSINTCDNSIVRIWKAAGNKYKLAELIEEYLPDLPMTPEEYRKWKRKAKKKTAGRTLVSQDGKIARLHNAYILCTDRMRCFEALRTYASQNHLREILTFLYVATALSINEDLDPVEVASEFNRGFPSPLPENELRWTFCITHAYSFRTETIAAKLGLPLEILAEYGLCSNRRARERAEKEANGETRKQKAEDHYEEYKRLADLGMKRKEIAREMGLSVETIKKYRQRRYRESDEA